MKSQINTASQDRAERTSIKTITDNKELHEIVNQFQSAPFLAVDTEFMRERTYYPQLCLVQISDGAIAVAIDPLAKGLDLTPVWALMRNKKIVKVFNTLGINVSFIEIETDGGHDSFLLEEPKLFEAMQGFIKSTYENL